MIKKGAEWAKAHPEAEAQNPLNWLKEDEEEGPRARLILAIKT